MKRPAAEPAASLRAGPGLVIVVQAAVIIALAWALAIYSRDEFHAGEGEADAGQAEQIAAPPQPQRGVVSLDAAAVRAADLAWQPVAPSGGGMAAVAAAVVVDLAPLLDARGRSLQMAAERRAAEAAAGAASLELQRLRALHADDRNVSERAVQAAEAAARREAARVEALGGQRGALLQALRQSWGEALARWAAGEGGQRALDGLASGREVLVQVAVAAAPATLQLTSADGSLRGTATVVGPAPRMEPGLAGATAFYRVGLPGARAGMRLSAQGQRKAPPGGASGAAGDVGGDAGDDVVGVPATAVVWHAGTAWVYLAEDAAEAAADGGAAEDTVRGEPPAAAAPPRAERHRFTRWAIDGSRDAVGDWRTARLRPGQAVVTRGAQFLLSEELRGQVHDENED